MSAQEKTQLFGSAF